MTKKSQKEENKNGTEGSKLSKEEQEELLKLFADEKPKVDDVLEKHRKQHSMVTPHPAETALANVAMPPIDRDPDYHGAVASAGDGTGNESGNYLPPLAGRGGEITGTVVAPEEQPGPHAFYVATVDANGQRTFFQSVSDAFGHFRLVLPAAAGLAAVEVFRHFDKNGQPDQGARCQISNQPAHVPDTQPLPHAPAHGPAILEANSSYERGGQGQGLIQLQTRGVNPQHAAVLVDGKPDAVDTLAASERGIVAKLHDDVALGRHAIAVASGSRKTNVFPTDVVTLQFDQAPQLKTGEVQPVTLHVVGVGPGEQATVTFTVSGAATLESGAESVKVPLQNGTASVRIRGVRPGALTIRVLLEVDLPEFRG